MGWLYMQSLDGRATPRAYLDNQLTYTTDTVRSTVLRSALVRMRTYYAAVEQRRAGTPPIVFAIVCLVRYNPRDREGYIFGYKDMDETMGPCETECPPAILDLLTEPDNEHAREWRVRCRAAADRRAKRPRLRNGWTVRFDAPLTFSDGSVHQRLDVAIDPAHPRAIRFRPPGGGPLYRIRNLHKLEYDIETDPLK